MSLVAAWTWVDHLRAGGTTPWAAWREQSSERPPGQEPDPRSGDRLLPGAQQLELVRHLNGAGRPPAALVERVLVASAPGRGRQDLELAGAVEPLAFGPRPIDPATLTADDLVRVALGLVAEDLVAVAPAPAEPVRARRWRTRYRLAGDPWVGDAMRAELRAQGRPPGGRGAVVAVVGADLATLLAHDWQTRCFTDGAAPWDEHVAVLRRRDRLPRRVDLARAAARWAEEAGGPHQVRVVLDPARVARAVGVRRLAPAPVVSLDATELARRAAGAVGLLVTPPQRADVLRRVLLPRLSAVAGPPPAVPEEHHDWVARQAARVRGALLAGGYPVLGDPDALLAHRPVQPAAVRHDPQRVLSLALDLLLRPATAPGDARTRGPEEGDA